MAPPALIISWPGLARASRPKFWNIDRPAEVLGLHRRFISAGAEIILSNSFGCNRQRLKLHKAEDRVYELAKRAAELARQAADAAARSVVVAGSVGPTGELFVPMGELTHEAAVESFTEQMRGLRDGGADVVWIETMSSAEELNAAAEASIEVGLPYVVTCSFDTAGRTMMGMLPDALDGIVAGQPVAPLAIGANCGVGAPDILVTLLAMQMQRTRWSSRATAAYPIFKALNAFTPARLNRWPNTLRSPLTRAARIIGGCCGTTPGHVAAMRAAIDSHVRGQRPTIETVVREVGALTKCGAIGPYCPASPALPKLRAPARLRGCRGCVPQGSAAPAPAAPEFAPQAA